MEDMQVSLNGRKVSYYEATQVQRGIERDIRETKRTLLTLDKANQDYKEYKTKLNYLHKEYTNFSKETGIDKQSERLFVIKE